MTHPNPVESYAKEEFPFDSITSLANAAGVGYGTVHKTIQGLYSSIPTKLADYMTMHSHRTSAQWQAKYSLWVEEELAILKSDIDRGAIEASTLFVTPERVVPRFEYFKEWRQSLSYSQIDFCKTFLLHQGIISKYEAGQMQNLPVSLKERLKFLGMSDAYIKAVGELKV
jgi:hypothetical protein